jgi:hypothetical protein
LPETAQQKQKGTFTGVFTAVARFRQSDIQTIGTVELLRIWSPLKRGAKPAQEEGKPAGQQAGLLFRARP